MWAFQQSGVVIPNNFSGIIIKRFGFSGIDSLLLTIPNWAMGMIGLIVIGWTCTHLQRLRKVKTVCKVSSCLLN